MEDTNKLIEEKKIRETLLVRTQERPDRFDVARGPHIHLYIPGHLRFKRGLLPLAYVDVCDGKCGWRRADLCSCPGSYSGHSSPRHRECGRCSTGSRQWSGLILKQPSRHGLSRSELELSRETERSKVFGAPRNLAALLEALRAARVSERRGKNDDVQLVALWRDSVIVKIYSHSPFTLLLPQKKQEDCQHSCQDAGARTPGASGPSGGPSQPASSLVATEPPHEAKERDPENPPWKVATQEIWHQLLLWRREH